MNAKPAFVAFTGVDTLEVLPEMKRLSSHYAIEWGILIDRRRAGCPRFPTADVIAGLLTAAGLRLAAHVCGDEAFAIANRSATVSLSLAGFQRLQVNHSFTGSSGEQIENCIRFGRSNGVRTVLQTPGEFPDEARLDWLFDASFGTGKVPSRWPSSADCAAFVGYSGGINPENVGEVLVVVGAYEDRQYWIDVESGVRTGGRFDPAKCESICRAVYG